MTCCSTQLVNGCYKCDFNTHLYSIHNFYISYTLIVKAFAHTMLCFFLLLLHMYTDQNVHIYLNINKTKSITYFLSSISYNIILITFWDFLFEFFYRLFLSSNHIINLKLFLRNILVENVFVWFRKICSSFSFLNFILYLHWSWFTYLPIKQNQLHNYIKRY